MQHAGTSRHQCGPCPPYLDMFDPHLATCSQTSALFACKHSHRCDTDPVGTSSLQRHWGTKCERRLRNGNGALVQVRDVPRSAASWSRSKAGVITFRRILAAPTKRCGDVVELSWTTAGGASLLSWSTRCLVIVIPENEILASMISSESLEGVVESSTKTTVRLLSQSR